MGKFGLIPIVYGVFCFIFNYLGYLVAGVPNLGALGSWIFNPLGMAFSGQLGGMLTDQLGLGWFGSLVNGGMVWLVGAGFGFLWTFGLIAIGALLLRR